MSGSHFYHAQFYAVVAGAVAGDVAVAGIKVTDKLKAVIFYAGAGVDVTDVSNLTSEFTITAKDTINNTGGTDTSGGKLEVIADQADPYGGDLNEE